MGYLIIISNFHQQPPSSNSSLPLVPTLFVPFHPHDNESNCKFLKAQKTQEEDFNQNSRNTSPPHHHHFIISITTLSPTHSSVNLDVLHHGSVDSTLELRGGLIGITAAALAVINSLSKRLLERRRAARHEDDLAV